MKKRMYSKLFLLVFVICIMHTGLIQAKEKSSPALKEVQQQKLKVRGTVNDEDGEPLIGVSVVIKNTTQGTITDIEGRYEIEVPFNSVMQFTYVGYERQEIRIDNKNVVNITLVVDSKTMDEIVVVGYGTQKKANLTGAVASLKFEGLADIPVSNTANILQGRLPGVTLTLNGAQAGRDNPEIRIRGIGTFGNNNPMVIIDGVESDVSQISQISPEDIESVSALKDAASGAIYGVRAANGVILITTKRGLNQKPRINFSTSIAWQKPTVLADFVDSWDWATLINESRKNQDQSQAYTPDAIKAMREGTDPDLYANTDWQREVFRTAPMSQHYISLTGGTDKVSYMFSMQYLNQKGIMRETENQRYNFRSNIDAKVAERITLGLDVSGNMQEISEPYTKVGDDENSIMRQFSWFTRPTVPVKYKNGHWGQIDGNYPIFSAIKNPLEALKTGDNNSKIYRLDAKTFAEIKLVKGLKFKTSLAYKYYSDEQFLFNPTNRTFDSKGGQLSENLHNFGKRQHKKAGTLLNEELITYNLVTGIHNFTALGGFSIQKYRDDWFMGEGTDFPNDEIKQLSTASKNKNIGGGAVEHSLRSYFGRLNYILLDRYLTEFNIRHDGSSRMPKANRSAVFPSFSLGWIISNENFMKSAPYISSLKLRGSWGQVGNQEIGDYAYTQYLDPKTHYVIDGKIQQGASINALANDKIKWETTTMTDVGLDLSVLKGRVSMSFDYFYKKSSDILFKLPIPATLGDVSPPYQNAGEVENKGWELLANYMDQQGDFSWQFGFNLSSVRNKILNMRGLESISGNTINREGYPIGAYYGYEAIGIYHTAQEIIDRGVTQFSGTTGSGDIMYWDRTKDDKITSEDRDIIGNPFPKLTFGINGSFGWKAVDFSMFWQGISGIKRFAWETSSISGNVTRQWMDRWTETNKSTSMPRLGGQNNDEYSTFYLKDAKYIRLKTIELGYTFSKMNCLQKAKIESIRLYFSGNNLLTFSPIKNYDPEKFSGDTRSDVHPNSKVYSFGLNVKF